MFCLCELCALLIGVLFVRLFVCFCARCFRVVCFAMFGCWFHVFVVFRLCGFLFGVVLCVYSPLVVT